jgi:hypothetical protein
VTWRTPLVTWRAPLVLQECDNIAFCLLWALSDKVRKKTEQSFPVSFQTKSQVKQLPWCSKLNSASGSRALRNAHCIAFHEKSFGQHQYLYW